MIRSLLRAALGVDVELPTLRPEVRSVCEAGAPQGAVRMVPENADALGPNVIVFEQVHVLLRRQRGQQLRAIPRFESRPGPLASLVGCGTRAVCVQQGA